MAAPTVAPVDDGEELVLRALGLLGTPYRFGGTDPATGFDCSGLVAHVFMAVRGQRLPRRSEEMAALGHPVDIRLIAAGDLVFFNTLGRPHSHVAIYVGERKFVHAPARGGVVRTESIDERYWRTRFNGARRLPTAAVP